VFDELELWISEQVRDVVAIARYEIIHANDFVSFSNEAITQMRSQKAGATRYQDLGQQIPPSSEPAPVLDHV
jgi:hypothetical protein